MVAQNFLRRHKKLAITAIISFFIGLLCHLFVRLPDPTSFAYAIFFYFSLLEILGLFLFGLLLFKFNREEWQHPIPLSLLNSVIYYVFAFVYLIFSGHPLSMTIFVLIYVLFGGEM